MKKSRVTLVEVGLRDGLQNEKSVVTLQNKIELTKRLVEAGSIRLELGAFVRPDRVPQMKDSAELLKYFYGIRSYSSVRESVLIPNEKGMELASEFPIKEIALFTAASESFNQKNINCSIEGSFLRFEPIVKLAKKKKMKIRGYLSTCFGCPYEGAVDMNKVVQLVSRLLKLGCYEVSIGDTIGVAVPTQIDSLVKKLKAKKIPLSKIAGHFHDTRGTALINIYHAYQLGITTFDSSIGGLGGCPFAPGAAGNVSTEDVVYMFEKMGVTTGLNLDRLIETNHWLSQVMQKKLPSKVGLAGDFKA